MTPGWDAPVTCTCVPMGSEPDVQPFVAVLPPVPEQWAAWPMSTVLEASEKTKFAVHCAPAVKVWTPGWIGAVAAGAHVGAALAEGASAATNGRATVAHVTAAAKTRASNFMGSSSLGGPHARYRPFGSITPISAGCTLPAESPSTPSRTSVRRLTGPLEAEGNGGETCASGARRRRGLQRGQAAADRAPVVVTRVRAATPPEAAGAGRLLDGRDRIDRVRDPGDPGGAGAGGGHGRARGPGADLAARRGAARARGPELPADVVRLSERRRLLHREPRDPRDEPVARGRGVAAGRLHADGLGVGCSRGCRDHFGDRSVAWSRGRARDGADRHHRHREPARRQRIGPAVRATDLCVRVDDDPVG